MWECGPIPSRLIWGVITKNGPGLARLLAFTPYTTFTSLSGTFKLLTWNEPLASVHSPPNVPIMMDGSNHTVIPHLRKNGNANFVCCLERSKSINTYWSKKGLPEVSHLTYTVRYLPNIIWYQREMFPYENHSQPLWSCQVFLMIDWKNRMNHWIECCDWDER